MSKIKWAGKITDVSSCQCGDLPADAVKIQTPQSVAAMQLRALPFVIPSIIALALCMGIRCYLERTLIISPPYILVGLAIGLALLVVHELLHAAVYPKNATVYLGFYPKGLSFVALASYPMGRARFAAMCLFPYVLGIVPLAAFCLTPHAYVTLNAIIFGTAVMGMCSPYPDAYNCYLVLRYAPKKSRVMFYSNDLYYFMDDAPQNEKTP